MKILSVSDFCAVLTVFIRFLYEEPLLLDKIIDYKKALQLLIENEIKPFGVRNPRLLEVLGKIPRHIFVPEKYINEAYFDNPISIGEGQTTSQPSLIAFMIQSLDLRENDTVLEIGTGCGYATALLALLVKKVYTVEINETLLSNAVKNFTGLNLFNINYLAGDGYQGWQEFAPFDAIMVNAASRQIPKSFIDQLEEGGKIIIPIGEVHSRQILTLGIKKGNQLFTKQLMEVYFVPLRSEEK